MIKPAWLVALAVGACCAAPTLGKAQGAPVPAAVDTDYRIGAYDMLDIQVFEVNDLNRTAQVDATGNIDLPLIGRVPAAGRTSAQLSNDIRSLLEAKYLNHASVTVQVKTSQSRRVTVDGAVHEPGVYPIGSGVTLIQAVALAKGLDDANANAHKVTIFRTVNTHWTSTAYDLVKIRHGQAEDPVLQAQDVVVVATSKKQAVLRDLGAVLPVVLLAAAL